MTAFDARLNVINVTIAKADDDKADHLLISMDIGQLMPFSASQGGQPITIPIGTIRFPMDGATAIRLGEDLKTAGEKLPKPSPLTVASSVEEASAMAAQMGSLKNGQTD